MDLVPKTLWQIARALVANKPMGILDESVLSMRVGLADLDLNAHMNNGRYLTIMDFGRFDLTVRTGLGKIALKQGWRPLVAEAHVKYRRSLAPFEKYTLHTRIAAWDAKWVFMEQRFVVGDTTCAIGTIKGLFRGPDGNVAPETILAAIGHSGPSPAIPPVFAAPSS